MNPTYKKIATHAAEFSVLLENACQMLGLRLTDVQKLQLLGYLDGLLLWSKAYNLTAITAPKEALIKHIFDCLAMVPKFVPDFLPTDNKMPLRVLDIGTGAGLPALILAVVCPHWQITAVDSNGKKVRFIRQMASELKITNLQPVAERVERHTGSYDVITSRAFASLNDFVQVASPLLAPNGYLCAMKGKLSQLDEVISAEIWHMASQAVEVPLLEDERCVVYLWR